MIIKTILLSFFFSHSFSRSFPLSHFPFGFCRSFNLCMQNSESVYCLHFEMQLKQLHIVVSAVNRLKPRHFETYVKIMHWFIIQKSIHCDCAFARSNCTAACWPFVCMKEWLHRCRMHWNCIWINVEQKQQRIKQEKKRHTQSKLTKKKSTNGWNNIEIYKIKVKQSIRYFHYQYV